MEAAVIDPLIFRLTIFVLAVFVGYYVVWSVTPALHTPLMAVTNAISSVIIVGALIAAGPPDMNLSKIAGLAAVALASVNIFGGFIVTHRMLSMFKRNQKKGGGRPRTRTSQRCSTSPPRSASSWRCADCRTRRPAAPATATA